MLYMLRNARQCYAKRSQCRVWQVPDLVIGLCCVPKYQVLFYTLLVLFSRSVTLFCLDMIGW